MNEGINNGRIKVTSTEPDGTKLITTTGLYNGKVASIKTEKESVTNTNKAKVLVDFMEILSLLNKDNTSSIKVIIKAEKGEPYRMITTWKVGMENRGR